MSLVAWMVIACGAPPASASTDGTQQLRNVGRWITDARGRVVVMHGTNMVNKRSPYYPASAGFGASDAAFLQSIGFTVVRIGVIWSEVEPKPGVYDNAYLNQIEATVGMLGKHGIVSILDFHQDQMNEEFAGEGFPTWAVQDDGLPNPKTAFPAGYTSNPALQRAYDSFWSDRTGPDGIGLQEYYAAAWKHVARRFAGNRWVLGYELINEPFPGSDYLQCFAGNCPTSDAELTSFEAKVSHAIRSVDPHTLIFYEPFVLFNYGVEDGAGSLPVRNAVFAWHNYCLSAGPCTSNTTDFQNAEEHIKSDGEAEFMTEFGAGPISDNQLVVSLADQNMVSWTNWSYCTCGDPTGNPDEGIVKNPGEPKAGSNLVVQNLEPIVEPYPHVVAGTPRSYGYTPQTKIFGFSYSTTKASGAGMFPAGSITEIETPRFVYPSGYGVHVDGGAIVSTANTGILDIASCPGARHVTVLVAPGNGSSDSCRSHDQVSSSG